MVEAFIRIRFKQIYRAGVELGLVRTLALISFLGSAAFILLMQTASTLTKGYVVGIYLLTLTLRIIRSLLLQLKEKEKTIIITSHIMETLTNLCDYIHYLEKGKIKYSRGKIDFPTFERELFESLENKNAKLIAELFK